jgi:hypothetical protein
MTFAWLLLITFHIGQGDQAVVSLPFADGGACRNAVVSIQKMPRMQWDYFACVNQSTGEVVLEPMP